MRPTDNIFVIRVRVTTLLVTCVLACAPARAQSAMEGIRIDSFSVVLKADSVTGADRSFAVLSPDGESRKAADARVVFACGADRDALSVGFVLPVRGGRDATLRILLRSAESEGDTLVLAGEEGRFLWYAGDADVAAAMLRAQTAGQVSIQMLSDSTPHHSAQFNFTFSGLDSVLRRLDCRMTQPLPANLAGREIIQSNFGEVGYVDVHPRLRNPAEVGEYLQQNYPPELWYAGVEGRTVVRFRILESGLVDSASVKVLQSTNQAFDAVAVGAVQRYLFRAASFKGQPVAAWVEQPINFRLPRGRPLNIDDLTRYVDRHYPVSLREMGVGGRVILRFFVLRDGRVERSSVRVRFSSNESFDDVAVRAVQELRFSPVEIGGDWVTMTVIFSPGSGVEHRSASPESVRSVDIAPPQL